jgi:vancomycin aglycone glucosyltransferase
VPPEFRELVESLGIPVTPIGPEVRRFAATPFDGHAAANAADGRAAASDDGSDGRDTVPAVVVATALQIAARSVAEKSGDSLCLRRLRAGVAANDNKLKAQNAERRAGERF